MESQGMEYLAHLLIESVGDLNAFIVRQGFVAVVEVVEYTDAADAGLVAQVPHGDDLHLGCRQFVVFVVFRHVSKNSET